LLSLNKQKLEGKNISVRMHALEGEEAKTPVRNQKTSVVVLQKARRGKCKKKRQNLWPDHVKPCRCHYCICLYDESKGKSLKGELEQEVGEELKFFWPQCSRLKKLGQMLDTGFRDDCIGPKEKEH
jgi:hypothetical protein